MFLSTNSTLCVNSALILIYWFFSWVWVISASSIPDNFYYLPDIVNITLLLRLIPRSGQVSVILAGFLWTLMGNTRTVLSLGLSLGSQLKLNSSQYSAYFPVNFEFSTHNSDRHGHHFHFSVISENCFLQFFGVILSLISGHFFTYKHWSVFSQILRKGLSRYLELPLCTALFSPKVALKFLDSQQALVKSRRVPTPSVFLLSTLQSGRIFQIASRDARLTCFSFLRDKLLFPVVQYPMFWKHFYVYIVQFLVILAEMVNPIPAILSSLETEIRHIFFPVSNFTKITSWMIVYGRKTHTIRTF